MNAKRFTLTAIAFGWLCIVLLALPAQAQQSYRGHTCEGLWEHVYAGGHVIFEETNKWFNRQCVREEEADDKEVKVKETVNSPTNVTCPYLPPRVVVFGHVTGTQCRMVGAAGVGRADLIERGVIDAVDVWSYVNGGLEVCFRNSGALVFLDAAYAPRMLMALESFQRDGMTCGRIDRPGTVALLREAATPAPEPQPTAEPTENALPLYDSIPQSDCQIKLEETLFLRAEPGGEIIGLVWLFSEVPVFEIHGDWYKIEFQGVTGYISRFYSRVLYGGCI